MYEVKLTRSAEQDLDSIFSYILNELKNAGAAEDFINEYLKACDNLKTMPKIYPYYNKPLGNAAEYRAAIIKHYLAIYRIDENNKKVIILRIVYSARQNFKLI